MTSGTAPSWHCLDAEACIVECKSSHAGLTQTEASNRLARHGPNALKERPRPPAVVRFLLQFNNPLIYMLIAAAIGALVIGYVTDSPGEKKDAIVIFIVITLNAILGFVQESRGEKAMEALKKLADPRATVVRDGQEVQIRAAELVPGDILILTEGVRIPADGRVLCANVLKVDESSLTGESKPVKKTTERAPEKAMLSDRTGMVYAGTTVLNGNGQALVTATGMGTEIGKIATMVEQAEESEEDTPLQKRLATLGGQIALYAGIICILVLFIGTLEARYVSNDLDTDKGVELLLTGVSLAVAVIPEGLPAIVTVALALGFQEMAKKNAIVRKLNAVETLGSTSVICTDKTGTLTKNEITVRHLELAAGSASVMGAGFDPRGVIRHRRGQGLATMPVTMRAPLERLLVAGVMCNNADLVREDGTWNVRGDPTEASLLTLGIKGGMDRARLARQYPRVREIPFSSDRKRMATVHRTNDKYVVFVKGAPDELIRRSDRIQIGNEAQTFAPQLKWNLLARNAAMARGAQRVLAFAYREFPDGTDIAALTEENVESDLVFLGMAGSVDPVRPEVKDALARCRQAGIKVVMITGDQPLTAMAVGQSLGMEARERNVLTGKELDELTDQEFMHAVGDIEIYSRATPAHKMRIVSTLQKQGHVVAMTGDGVNDAPALSQSDIGVAMGQKGTDVAREASDIILTDDNFATIVAAVEEGRKIFDNIKRFIRYQLSTNVGAILLIILSVIFLLPLPLYPAELLYINIIIDGPPAMALAMEPTTSNVMQRKPRKPEEGVLDRWMMTNIIIIGAVMGVGTLVLYYASGPSVDDTHALNHARTVAFTGFVVYQLANVMNCRSEERSVFSMGVRSNRYILLAVVGTMLIHLAVVYAPPIQEFFRTTALTLTDWVLIGLYVAIIFLINEILVTIKTRYLPRNGT